jgi:hypothetical protein
VVSPLLLLPLHAPSLLVITMVFSGLDFLLWCEGRRRDGESFWCWLEQDVFCRYLLGVCCVVSIYDMEYSLHGVIVPYRRDATASDQQVSCQFIVWSMYRC